MKFFSLTFLLFFTIACSSTKDSISKINAVEVSDKLIKGKTTQTQVLENFGAPDVVEKTPEGDMWAYNRHANESNSVGGSLSHYAYTGFWAWSGMRVGGDTSTSSTKTASLILYFGKNKTLSTYTYRTEKF